MMAFNQPGRNLQLLALDASEGQPELGETEEAGRVVHTKIRGVLRGQVPLDATSFRA